MRITITITITPARCPVVARPGHAAGQQALITPDAKKHVGAKDEWTRRLRVCRQRVG